MSQPQSLQPVPNGHGVPQAQPIYQMATPQSTPSQPAPPQYVVAAAPQPQPQAQPLAQPTYQPQPEPSLLDAIAQRVYAQMQGVQPVAQPAVPPAAAQPQQFVMQPAPQPAAQPVNPPHQAPLQPLLATGAAPGQPMVVPHWSQMNGAQFSALPQEAQDAVVAQMTAEHKAQSHSPAIIATA